MFSVQQVCNSFLSNCCQNHGDNASFAQRIYSLMQENGIPVLPQVWTWLCSCLCYKLLFVSTKDENRVDITPCWLSHPITTLAVLLVTDGNLTSSIYCLQCEKNMNRDSSVSSDMRIVEVYMATTVGRVYAELSFLPHEIQCCDCKGKWYGYSRNDYFMTPCLFFPNRPLMITSFCSAKPTAQQHLNYSSRSVKAHKSLINLRSWQGVSMPFLLLWIMMA